MAPPNPAFLAFEQKFPAWKNFPFGLHILLLVEDLSSLSDAQLRLEACNYSVTAFSDRQTALSAVQDPRNAFHLVIVEVNPDNAAESFDIVRAAKNLPTILLSGTENLTTMMEGIAAGATEFIEKPLSEDKLKNLWQHVFRRALVTGELVLPRHLSSATDSSSTEVNEVIVEQQAVTTITEPADQVSGNTEGVAETPLLSKKADEIEEQEKPSSKGDEQSERKSFIGELKLDTVENNDLWVDSAPSTPQLERAARVSISLDGSHQSDDCACVKSEVEDDLSTDNDCGFVQAQNEAEDMDGIDLFNGSYEGDEFPSLHDLDSLEAVLCEDVDEMHYEGLDLQDSSTMSHDLVDELLCMDIHSSILDSVGNDKSMQLSLDCMDEAEQNDEEALLLAEVAKVEAGMADSNIVSGCMSESGSSHRQELHVKQPIKTAADSPRHVKGDKSIGSKKKMKVDWTPELHRCFVQAVEQLGVDKAIPSKILEIMGVEHLTRHNIASHLQKYRSHKKHLQVRDTTSVSWNPKRQMESVPRPPQPHVIPRPTPIVPMGLHVWGHPSPDHFWPKTWQAPDGTIWHQPPPVGIDAWGHPATGSPFYPQPVMRLPLAPMPGVANRMIPVQTQAEKIASLHPPKERVDAAIDEVLKNPFTPLPLGLKPPSVESVLSELQKQGIKTVPTSSRAS